MTGRRSAVATVPSILVGALITLAGTFIACLIIAVVAYALKVASRLFGSR